MTTSSTFAIVGGGLAGAKAAEALRDNDFDGHIVLFAAEEHLPYERPPLSKEYLAGKKPLDDFTVDLVGLVSRPPRRPAAWHRGDGDRPVSAHRRASRRQHRALRQAPARHRLAVAAAADSRRRRRRRALPAHRRRRRRAEFASLAEGSSLAIVGARLDRSGGRRRGPRTRGVNVTVVETAELPLLAALGREVGEVFADLHRDHGVDLRLGATVAARSPPPAARRRD